jgi:pSer/pThr/pTyr-binding forkhead associated (FHA) protein
MEAQLVLFRALVLALLYGFLGLVAWFSWRDLKAARRDEPAAEASAAARLIVLDGGTSDRPAGTAFDLQAVTAVGREFDNEVVFRDETVSGRHAVLSARDGGWWIEDLRSTNGTALNGRLVAPEMPELLRSGDLVQMGAIRVRVVIREV